MQIFGRTEATSAREICKTMVALVLLFTFIVCAAGGSSVVKMDMYNEPTRLRAGRDKVDGLWERSKLHLQYAEKAKKQERLHDRHMMVEQELKMASGVYRDKEKGGKMGLQNTVVAVVVSYPKGKNHYKHYFRNFLCFAHKYGYDLVVYVLRNHEADYKTYLQHVAEIGKLGVKALPYPEELFWRLVYSKAGKIKEGKGFAPWTGDKPNFDQYGALTMLVPTYEMVRLHGKDVLYFDVDQGLILDPVPHMVLGDSDFSFSIENRFCKEKYFASDVHTMEWDKLEPNTGVMVVRSTPQSVTTFTSWLESLVDNNMMNDQRVFTTAFINSHNMTYATNCLPKGTKGAITDSPSIRKSDNSSTYCFLSDIVFQNGMTSLQVRFNPMLCYHVI